VALIGAPYFIYLLIKTKWEEYDRND